ncbi:hypothetical protein [Candidatus Magnetominusculus xianensis]|uniref:FlgO domain-containing protein n=1 Tax=Candidatus Magnetominusculus xianensis TaxID=1748249 RepID=A0ABR5SIT2_9BACT|nr:hypothetical protein [Candidatus Magnetominusculus xianensis]KWT91550.1 hypothetical protein ASN18_0831 [Candidatus Magnetominusculus xianensis]MBF0404336.1 hypothetical protein [Nitrospirota bacterium]
MTYKVLIFMKVIVLTATMLLFTNSVFAETIKEVERIIRTEMPYPRDDRYTIPAILPDSKSTDKKNQLYLKIANALEGKGLIKLITQGSVTKIQPVENTYDIVHQNLDQKYVLQSVSIILGVFRMKAISMHTQGDKTIVSGERLLMNKTSACDILLKLLPEGEVKDYSPSPVQWIIQRRNGQVNVTEKTQ